ncbi:MAG: DNA repair protein RecO [Acholeplasmatales bacterium]|nr:DNA repair protein RecO [Acholeplasmatales bacterium]
MKLEGIVLSEIDYKEASKIVNLYTEKGKIGVKALGSKKIKNGLLGFITTGNTVSFVTTDKEVYTLIEYDIIDSIMKKDLDINEMKALGTILYIINMIPSDSPHEKIYPFVKDILSNIKNINIDKLLSIFLIKMLYPFGISPNLKSCVKCQNKHDLIAFDIAYGGALCKNCIDKNNNIEIWNEYYYDKKDLKEYSDTDFTYLLNQIKNYYSYHLNIRLKI